MSLACAKLPLVEYDLAKWWMISVVEKGHLMLDVDMPDRSLAGVFRRNGIRFIRKEKQTIVFYMGVVVVCLVWCKASRF